MANPLKKSGSFQSSPISTCRHRLFLSSSTRRVQVRNPVMFVVEISSLLPPACDPGLAGKGEAPTWFIGAIAIWLVGSPSSFPTSPKTLPKGGVKARPKPAPTRQETTAKIIIQSASQRRPSQRINPVPSTILRREILSWGCRRHHPGGWRSDRKAFASVMNPP